MASSLRLASRSAGTDSDIFSDALRSAPEHWRAETIAFFKERPDATLFSLLLHLWPDYIRQPEKERIDRWYAIEAELNWLASRGPLQKRTSLEGVVTWSMRQPAGKEG